MDSLTPDPEQLLQSRISLLWGLNVIVDEEEELVQTLLKAFDLKLDLYQEPDVPAFNPDALYSASFLSTPLRTKHFSRLSPSILRGLLRSPSLRSEFEDSLDDISVISPNRHTASECNTHGPSPPLTPPPTARIPDSEQLPNVDIFAGSQVQDITDSVRASSLLSPPKRAAANYLLLSPAAVRNFKRVIDEMKGFGPESGEAIAERKNPVRSCPASPCVGLLHTTSTPARNGFGTLGVLEEEFVRLLEQRAADEAAHAKELREIADRLDALARSKRKLAAVITEKQED
ncbi:hypothetical protein HMN09_00518800 [Mycena chlorophos]|uniref:Uncharacterized protein n=1 Tax=Mycena chlorophos TaxID=658473 RepID=A0A8H6TA80_MYCCL|nr:hypothetical protein HMN09_00518800 [Mycena chlorophos]